MPKFTALATVTEAPHGVTLRLPMPAGTTTNVSEDEAAVLRVLPALFSEVFERQPQPWTGRSPLNRMVDTAQVKKDAEE